MSATVVSTTIEWATPPSRHAGTLFTPEVVEALQSRRGEWACLRRGSRTVSVLYMYAKRHPEFEVRTVQSAPNQFDLYARYIGDAS